MKRTTGRPIGTIAVSLVMTCVMSVAGAVQAAQAQSAMEILDAAGVKGGLVVHIGCGDGKLTAALRANDSYLVHGLDTDVPNVEKARQHIKSLGIYGKVSVDRLAGERLPYVDNLVNLIVAESLGNLSMDEVMRVLCPMGVAYVKRSGKWEKTVKPRPEEIDEWTHYLHDATGNVVSHDTVVDLPRRLQWVGSPRWARHHDHMASMSALVSTGGRIFYIFDEGPTSSIELPPKWKLIARDAFNGTVLWKRDIPSWHPHMWPFKSGHAQLPRRLVAVGERVYVTLGIDAPLSALDAATGETVRTYEGTEATEEVIASDGVLFLLGNEPPNESLTDWSEYRQTHRNIGQEKQRVAAEWPWNEAKRRLLAAEAKTGQLLWGKEQRVVPLTLAADQKGVFFHDGEKIVCLDRKTGDEMWHSAPVSRQPSIPTCFGPTLVVYQDVVLFSGGDRSVTALSAETGETLWTADHPPSGHFSPEDLLVVDGLVWAGEIAGGGHSGIFTGRDLHTGEVRKQFEPDVDTYWFHHRCYRSKAADHYILPSRTGIEFVDVRSEHWSTNHWVRGGCLYGIMPANGLIYTPAHDCACYIESKLYGFRALAPEFKAGRELRIVSDESRLERGPAYGKPLGSLGTYANEWPTYRHDSARSGFTQASVPAELKPAWQTELGGRLSSPVIAGGRVFVASVDFHTVYALDATSGSTLWSYTAGGRVDSPPTIYEGKVLFGSADGWVYCLRASDGELIWRFRAAPEDRRLMAFEQVESVWPMHGSVLIEDGALYCVAGRSMFLDGGMRLCRLDPGTGRKLSETVLDERDPETGENLQVKVRGLDMPVALPDVLSSDGRHVYMRSQRFDLEGVRPEVVTPTRETLAHQQGEGAHLFCPTGFLDDSWFHRSYWIFGKTFLGGAGGYPLAGRFAPAGRILVFDESLVYGFGRKPQYFTWTTPLEYHLFGIDKQSGIVKPEGPEPVPPPVPKGMTLAELRKDQKKLAELMKDEEWRKKAEAYVEALRKRGAGRLDYRWSEQVPLLARAMVLADETLFIAGPPDVVDEEEAFDNPRDAHIQAKLDEQSAALEGQQGALLWAVSASDGEKLAEYKLESLPVFDGMASAGGNLYITLQDGRVICMGG